MTFPKGPRAARRFIARFISRRGCRLRGRPRHQRRGPCRRKPARSASVCRCSLRRSGSRTTTTCRCTRSRQGLDILAPVNSNGDPAQQITDMNNILNLGAKGIVVGSAGFGRDQPRARCAVGEERAGRRRRRRADSRQSRDGGARRQSRVRRDGVQVHRRAREVGQGRADHGRSGVGERARPFGSVPCVSEEISGAVAARNSRRHGRVMSRRPRSTAC